MKRIEKLDILEDNLRMLMRQNSKEEDVCEMLDEVIDKIHKLKMEEHEQQK